MKIARNVFVALAAILAFIVWLHFHDASVRAEAAQVQQDTRTDSLVTILRNESVARAKAFDRERDSTERVIQDLTSRIRRDTLGKSAAPREYIYPQPEHADSASIYTAVDVRDSLIAALVAGRQQDSLQLLFWKAQVAQRDSVIAVLQASRDVWRRAANPSLVTRVGKALPWLAGAYLAGRLTK